jgi:hypothetical protein
MADAAEQQQAHEVVDAGAAIQSSVEMAAAGDRRPDIAAVSVSVSEAPPPAVVATPSAAVGSTPAVGATPAVAVVLDKATIRQIMTGLVLAVFLAALDQTIVSSALPLM